MASEAAIAEAEALLGHAFPPTYLTFPRKLGAGDINGAEVYGIIGDDAPGSAVPSIVWLSEDLRAGKDWPSKYLVVASSGDGGWHCLDASRETEGRQMPVVWCDPNAKQVLTKHQSFGEYSLEAVTGM